MKNTPIKKDGNGPGDRQNDKTVIEELHISPAEWFDTFFPRLREALAFVGGFGIMVFEAVGDKTDRPWLFAAAIGMMGLPIARYAEGTLARWGSNRAGPAEAPPEDTPQISKRRR